MRDFMVNCIVIKGKSHFGYTLVTISKIGTKEVDRYSHKYLKTLGKFLNAPVAQMDRATDF